MYKNLIRLKAMFHHRNRKSLGLQEVFKEQEINNYLSQI